MSDIAKLLKEKWAELVVLGAVLGLYGVVFYDIRDRLTRAESTNSETEKRLDRIANAFPEVGIRIAQEQSLKSIGTMVLVSAPVAGKDGWQAAATVYDITNGKGASFAYPLKNANDLVSIWALEGAIKSSSTGSQGQKSLAAFEKLREAGYVKEKFDAKLLPDASFVFSGDYEEIVTKVKAAGAVQKDLFNFKGGEYSWDETAKLVNSGIVPVPKM